MGSTRGAGLGAPSPRASGAGSGTRTSSFFVGPGLGYGYGMGMGYGVGYGGGGFFNLVLFAMLALAASNALQNAMGRGGFGDGLSAGGDSISVVKIQVGLLGSARALQKDLERIADKADTSSPDGLHFVLSETVLALLRNPEYCVYGYAASKVCRGPEQAEETFNDYSIDERGKFEKETLVNVNARRRAETVGVDPAADTNDYILVTIIAAADGGVKMPDITDANDLKTALKRLGAVRVEALQAVEVLWTPQEDGDVLTQTELLARLPHPRQLVRPVARRASIASLRAFARPARRIARKTQRSPSSRSARAPSREARPRTKKPLTSRRFGSFVRPRAARHVAARRPTTTRPARDARARSRSIDKEFNAPTCAPTRAPRTLDAARATLRRLALRAHRCDSAPGGPSVVARRRDDDGRARTPRAVRRRAMRSR